MECVGVCDRNSFRLKKCVVRRVKWSECQEAGDEPKGMRGQGSVLSMECETEVVVASLAPQLQTQYI